LIRNTTDYVFAAGKSFTEGSENLMYATLKGSDWVYQSIHSFQVYIKSDVSIVVDNHGVPYVSYVSDDGTLKLASLTGSNWNIQPISSNGISPKLAMIRRALSK
jgi:hypothetical protein